MRYTFVKISITVSELLSGHEVMTDGRTGRQTEGQTDGQGDNYRTSADFDWRGPNETHF